METINNGIQVLICENCHGTGRILPKEVHERISLSESEWVQPPVRTCYYCNGTGRLIRKYSDFKVSSEEMAEFSYSEDGLCVCQEKYIK